MSKTVDWPHPCAGERNRLAKLTEEQAREIKRSRGKLRVVAAKYGVSQFAVWSIRHGKRWAWLSESPNPKNWKITPEQVGQIATLAEVGIPNSVIARLYGISRSHVSKIVLRKRWKRL